MYFVSQPASWVLGAKHVSNPGFKKEAPLDVYLSSSGGSLDALGALDTLQLQQNLLTSLAAGTFTELLKLRLLDLSSNLLAAIDPGVFQGLDELRHLYLGGNQISAVGPTPGDLLLASLPAPGARARREDAVTAPTAAAAPTAAVSPVKIAMPLVRNATKATAKPATAKPAFANLETLDLTRNELTEIPVALFATLNQLTELRLASNRITHISPFVGLGQLQRLDLNHNHIRHVGPAAFGTLKQLQILYVVHLPSLRCHNGSVMSTLCSIDIKIAMAVLCQRCAALT